MRRIVGNRLEYLGHHAICVAIEQVAQRQRSSFCFFEPTKIDPLGDAAQLDFRARVGRQMPVPDNAARNSLAAKQGHVDRMSVEKDWHSQPVLYFRAIPDRSSNPVWMIFRSCARSEASYSRRYQAFSLRCAV